MESTRLVVESAEANGALLAEHFQCFRGGGEHMFFHRVYIACNEAEASNVKALFNARYPDIKRCVAGFHSFEVTDANETPEPEKLAFKGVELTVKFLTRENCAFYIDDEKCPLHAEFKTELAEMLGYSADNLTDFFALIDVVGRTDLDLQSVWRTLNVFEKTKPIDVDGDSTQYLDSLDLVESYLSEAPKRPSSPHTNLHNMCPGECSLRDDEIDGVKQRLINCSELILFLIRDSKERYPIIYDVLKTQVLMSAKAGGGVEAFQLAAPVAPAPAPAPAAPAPAASKPTVEA